MKAKSLAFLLSLAFLFLFSDFVFGQEPEVKREYWENGKLRNEIHYKDGKRNGLWTTWHESGKKSSEYMYKDGKQEGLSLTIGARRNLNFTFPDISSSAFGRMRVFYASWRG